MSRPRYKPGLPFLPAPQRQAFGSNLFHEGPGCAGEGVALGWKPCCTAGNLRDAFGCVWREQHPGLQAGWEQGTDGHLHSVTWKALNGLGVHSLVLQCDMIDVLPLLGRAVCSVTP